MSRTSTTLQLIVVLVIICICNTVFSEDSTLIRHKKGFRLNSASRVAHGYGKRGGYLSSNSDVISSLPKLGEVEALTNYLDETNEGSLLSVNDFVDLLSSHPKLTRALVKKFIDIDGDDVISSAELFRPVISKK